MERILTANDAQLCLEAFGSPDDPTILLIGGRSASMDYWEEDFCDLLAAGGRHVVRYDLRDTGRSVTCPPGEPDYTFADLVADAVGVLDALGVRAAHLVGISMGGAIAQCVAVGHPDRVATLTLVATAPALDGDVALGLPEPEPELQQYFAVAAARPAPDWSDRDALVAMLLQDQRAFMRGEVDERRVRAVVERAVDRSTDLEAMGNHGLIAPGATPEGGLGDIAAPTLVIHGTQDPLFPPPHGQALAAAIPGATLLALAGVGHEAPPARTWDVVVPALLRHTGG